MKLSLNWIRDYVDLPQDLDMKQLAHTLTMRTVEVEGYENPADALKQVVAAKIISVEAHPNADRLRVCQLDVGAEAPVQVVCGGSNLELGHYVVLAQPGAVVVWHGEGDPVTIKAGKLRGVASDGMICGAEEVGLDGLFPALEEHEIVDLSERLSEDSEEASRLKPGAAISEVLGLDDVILEIDNKSMTHRPDLWGHYGLARELAAIYERPLKALPEFELPKDACDFEVKIESEKRSARYTATVIEGVEVKPAPFWMQKRLSLCGQRPINALVDLTNYVMLASGQPTHAFDRRSVNGLLFVRQAKDQEVLRLLDDRELKLQTDDLVIAGEQEAMALAGVMGGLKDSVLEDTRAIVLEAAHFESTGVRRTQQRYGVRTDASSRFEKAIDPERVDQALALALTLLPEIFPEAKVTQHTDLFLAPTKKICIDCDQHFLAARMGKEVNLGLLKEKLEPLGFGVQEKEAGHYLVEVPTYRSTGDVSEAYDILEELARLVGYEHFSFQAPQILLEQAVSHPAIDFRRRVLEYLAYERGYQEIFSFPWQHERYVEACGESVEEALQLEAPPAPETKALRQSLMPNMLEALEKNAKHFDHFKICELTQVFSTKEPAYTEGGELKRVQPHHLAGLELTRLDQIERVLRETKGTIEGLSKLGVSPLAFRQIEKPAYADPKLWLNIVHKDQPEKIVGTLAFLSPKVNRLCDLKKQAVCVFEMNLDALTLGHDPVGPFKAIPATDPPQADLSMLVDESVPWSEFERVLSPQVLSLTYLEAYRGAQIPEGKKSVHFSMTLKMDQAQATMEEIDHELRRLAKRLSKELGAVLRG